MTHINRIDYRIPHFTIACRLSIRRCSSKPAHVAKGFFFVLFCFVLFCFVFLENWCFKFLQKVKLFVHN